jgi:hypothetical protein
LPIKQPANKIEEKIVTYIKIQEYVKIKYGFSPKTCWIADAKELCGLTVRKAWNRKGKQRKNPCPKDKFAAIKEALNHFELLDK